MEWKKENNSLVKELEFKDFNEVIEFVNKIAKISEKLDHHPDIFIHSYKKLKITINTHSEECITNKDYLLAKEINKL